MAWQEDLRATLGEVSLGVHVWRSGCLIEGHRGLLVYTPTCVKVRRKSGAVTIEGASLCILCISRDEIWLRGDIKGVTLDE